MNYEILKIRKLKIRKSKIRGEKKFLKYEQKNIFFEEIRKNH